MSVLDRFRFRPRASGGPSEPRGTMATPAISPPWWRRWPRPGIPSPATGAQRPVERRCSVGSPRTQQRGRAQVDAPRPAPSPLTRAKPGIGRSGSRPALVLVSAGLLLAMAIGTAAASAPGGPLYGLRVTSEELLLPAAPAERLRAQVSRLDGRLAEASGAAMRGDSGAVIASLRAYIQIAAEAAAGQPADAATVDQLVVRVRAQLELLSTFGAERRCARGRPNGGRAGGSCTSRGPGRAGRWSRARPRPLGLRRSLVERPAADTLAGARDAGRARPFDASSLVRVAEGPPDACRERGAEGLAWPGSDARSHPIADAFPGARHSGARREWRPVLDAGRRRFRSRIPRGWGCLHSAAQQRIRPGRWWPRLLPDARRPPLSPPRGEGRGLQATTRLGMDARMDSPPRDPSPPGPADRSRCARLRPAHSPRRWSRHAPRQSP